jgi:hypothetical protein
MIVMKTGIVYTITGFSDIIHYPAFIKKIENWTLPQSSGKSLISFLNKKQDG